MLTSAKIVSVKSLSQPSAILFVKAQIKNPLVIKFVLPPSCHKFQSLLKHTSSAQLVSVRYIAMLPLLFLKHYAETKVKLVALFFAEQPQKWHCQSKKGSLPMTPICEIRLCRHLQKKSST